MKTRPNFVSMSTSPKTMMLRGKTGLSASLLLQNLLIKTFRPRKVLKSNAIDPKSCNQNYESIKHDFSIIIICHR